MFLFVCEVFSWHKHVIQIGTKSSAASLWILSKKRLRAASCKSQQEKITQQENTFDT